MIRARCFRVRPGVDLEFSRGGGDFKNIFKNFNDSNTPPSSNPLLGEPTLGSQKMIKKTHVAVL